MIFRMKRFLVFAVVIAVVIAAIGTAGFWSTVFAHRLLAVIPWSANAREQRLDWVVSAFTLPALVGFFSLAQTVDWTARLARRIRLPRRPVPLDELKAKTQQGNRNDFRRAISG